VLEGTFSIDLAGIRTTKAKLQGKNATSASVFVPREWAGKDVIVLLAANGGLSIGNTKDSDN
jgi:hypothetical protein